MSTTFYDPVAITSADVANLDVGTSLFVAHHTSITIGSFTGTGEEVGKLLNILSKSLPKDYPEEFF